MIGADLGAELKVHCSVLTSRCTLWFCHIYATRGVLTAGRGVGRAFGGAGDFRRARENLLSALDKYRQAESGQRVITEVEEMLKKVEEGERVAAKREEDDKKRRAYLNGGQKALEMALEALAEGHQVRCSKLRSDAMVSGHAMMVGDASVELCGGVRWVMGCDDGRRCQPVRRDVVMGNCRPVCGPMQACAVRFSDGRCMSARWALQLW